MNKKYIYSAIGMSTIIGTMGAYELKTHSLSDIPSLLTFTSLDQIKILDMDFNNNSITNKVNNKTYSTAKGTGKLVSSIKGNGFEFNNDYATIPKSDLDIKDTDTVVTVAFTYRHDGTDPDGFAYLISFGNYNLQLGSDRIGFNTMSSDIIGFYHGFEKGKTYHITAEFHKNDVYANKIYVNGISKPISPVHGTHTPNNNVALFDNNLTIGTITNDTASNVYTANDQSVIDEIKIYKRALTQSEVNNVSNAHKIPELRSEVVSNKYPKLTWATEMLEENILWSSGFEDNEVMPSGLPSTCNFFEFNKKYSGYRSIRITDSINPNFANEKYPIENVYRSRMNYNSIYGLQPGMKFSASFKVKNESTNAKIHLVPESTTLVKNTTPFHTVYGLSQPVIISESTNGDRFIYIENFDSVYNELMSKYEDKGNFMVRIANKVDDNYGATYQTITKDSFDLINKRIITNMNCDYKRGDVLQYIFYSYPLSLTQQTISNDSDWTTYNVNGTMQNPYNYDIENRGLRLVFLTYNTSSLYIDDFKMGHATKVRLYKNNSMIYEGYESEFNDTSSIDTNAPNKVNNINATMEMTNPTNSTRKLTINFNATDIGTTYNYQISAISKEGVETPKSNNLSQTVTSGIKGYSYIIDKNPLTLPSNTVNLTTNSIETNITDTGVYYLHIKTIDNQGNVSDVVHHKIDVPSVITTSNPVEDNIRLDWNMNDLKDNTFKVYKKAEGEVEFQSISATNLDDGKKVKVLLAYPEGTCSMGDTKQPMISYIDKDGSIVEIPLSASIKKWMEEPKEGYPKGYGMGVIEVDIVSIKDFNANANNNLKNADGTYKYDVFVLGIADCNGGREAIDDNSTAVLSEFIESGRGVFFGHDTVYDDTRNPNALLAKKYMNMTLDSNRSSSFSDNKVQISKKGLLTTFPHKIGSVGDILNIPASHTSHQIPNSIDDNWLVYSNGDKSNKKNFYLTTYNNFAMSQTGHSTGQATEDEQKILANALFYLNQLGTDNYLNDNSGQDVKAPNNINNITHSFNNGVVNFTFPQVIDNGSTYSYYVETESKNGERKTLSNVSTATITSGMAGYSFVIDNSPTTIPDNTVDTTSNNISKAITSNNMYLHVLSVDNVGNVSETTHYQLLDTTNPIMNITGNPTTWTNQNVVLNITANDVGTGIKHIILPNGTIVSGSSANYTVTTNGSYTFQVVDNMGNITTQIVNVNKIDKLIDYVANVTHTMEIVDANLSSRRINLTFPQITDSLSGLKGYSYVIDKNPITVPNNTVNTKNNSISYTITDSGVYYLHLKTLDNAGNVSGTTHYKIDIPSLITTSNPVEDKIRLDWDMNDLKNKNFKVYKKQEGESNFQSISMTNLDTSKQVRVLNIFPTYNVPLKTDGSVDINNKPMCQSGMLNEWIQDYGMGVISVDSLNKEDFELNPDKWLKDENGEYKYDVITVGFWNISVRQQHLNNTGSDAIGEFIDSGRGVLVGHHHIGYREFDYGINRLKEKFGVKLIKEQGAYQTNLGNIDYVLPEASPGMDYSYYWNTGTKVQAVKKGILLNYPHNIAQEGKIFTVPNSHDSWEFTMGDVWMQYVNQTAFVAPFGTLLAKDITILPDGSSGTSNAYLHTYNNTAIIQTGHSNNSATEDEKKIVANTIFYLNQLSTDNYLEDNSGQDVGKPNTPVVYEHNFISKSKLDLNFHGVIDNGTSYDYYVQSEDRNGEMAISDIRRETITSGLKGYSYVVDSSPNTIPDADIEISNVQTLKVDINENTKYIHIKAIDNVGNSSETYHYKITESTKPTLTITGNPTEWTNKDVVLNITANDIDSGLNYIELPNGNRVRSNDTTYTITQNGSYTFKAVDFMGNETTQVVVVSKIDKENPYFNNTTTYNNAKTESTITLSMSDSLSGLDYLLLPDGTKIGSLTNSYVFKTNDNGVYPFELYDRVGNRTLIAVRIDNLNANVVPSEIDRIEYKLSGATTKDWTTYTGAFYITNEGVTTITSRSYDNAGNVSNEITSIAKVDKTKPNNNFILIELYN